jgi:hypothetical protein
MTRTNWNRKSQLADSGEARKYFFFEKKKQKTFILFRA